MADNLKSRVMRAGSQLVVRQICGMIISLLGTAAIARLIGPTNYGFYVTATATLGYIFVFCEFGMTPYLVRRQDITLEIEHQVFTFLAAFSVLAGALLAAIVYWSDAFSADRWSTLPFIVSIPLPLLNVVPLARMERQLRYRTIVQIELTTMLVSYLISVPYALYRPDMWGPAYGFLGLQICGFVMVYYNAGYRPRLVWHPSIIKDIARYGVGMSSAQWIWQARKLINPWIVGPIAGPEVVGTIALAIRFIDTLAFAKTSATRIAVVVLGHLRDNRAKMSATIEEVSLLLTLTVGSCLIVFAVIGPPLVEWLLGSQWNSIFLVYPFLAIALLVNCMFSFHMTLLYVLGRNVEVIKGCIASVGVLAIGALIFVPGYGIIGYGIAELLAMPAYILFQCYAARQLDRRPSYGLAALWTIGFMVGIFYPKTIGVLLIASIALYPKLWTIVERNIQTLRTSWAKS